MKKWKRYGIFLLIIACLIKPSALFVILAFFIYAFDSFGQFIWPNALDIEQRSFLSVLWISGIIFMLGLFLAGKRNKEKSYYLGIPVAIAIFSGITFANMPLSAEDAKRWQGEKNVKNSGWYDEINGSSRQIIALLKAVNEGGFQLKFKLRNFYESTANVPKLASDPQDIEETTTIFTQAAKQDINRYVFKDVVAQLKSRLNWIPDTPNLQLAYALFELIDTYQPLNKELEDNQRPFYRAIQLSPYNTVAWRGLAVSYLLDNPYKVVERISTSPFSAVELSLSAFMMSDYLKRAGLGITDNELDQLLDNIIADMPERFSQAITILQARAKVKNTYLVGSKPSHDLIQQAKHALNLEFENKPEVNRVRLVNKGVRYPGIVNVDSQKYGIIANSVPEIVFPELDKYVRRAVVTVAVDVNQEGYPVFASVVSSSGYTLLDELALESIPQWRFHAPGQAEYREIQVEFTSTLLSWDDYIKDLQPYVEAVALAIARQDNKNSALSLNNLNKYRQQFSPNSAANINQAANQRLNGMRSAGLYNIGNNSTTSSRNSNNTLREMIQQSFKNEGSNAENWESSVKAMQEFQASHTDDPEILALLGRTEFLYYSAARKSLMRGENQFVKDDKKWRELLLTSRQHFLEVIALDSTRADGWFGWAVTLVDEDPELAAGGLGMFAKLYNDESLRDVSQQLQLRFMAQGLTDEGAERFAIIEARMKQIYHPEGTDKGNDYFVRQYNESEADYAMRVIPAIKVFPIQRIGSEPSSKQRIDDNLNIRINFDAAGINTKNRTLPNFILRDDKIVNGELILQIDLDKQGVPSAVFVKMSSGIVEFDNAAVKTAYQWRFNAKSKGWTTLVPVNFSRITRSQTNNSQTNNRDDQ